MENSKLCAIRVSDLSWVLYDRKNTVKKIMRSYLNTRMGILPLKVDEDTKIDVFVALCFAVLDFFLVMMCSNHVCSIGDGTGLENPPGSVFVLSVILFFVLLIRQRKNIHILFSNWRKKEEKAFVQKALDLVFDQPPERLKVYGDPCSLYVLHDPETDRYEVAIFGDLDKRFNDKWWQVRREFQKRFDFFERFGFIVKKASEGSKTYVVSLNGSICRMFKEEGVLDNYPNAVIKLLSD